jgi:hypothetical protein
MSKEMYWNPLIESFKKPEEKLKSLEIQSNDIINLIPMGKAKENSEIKKYNVVVTYM